MGVMQVFPEKSQQVDVVAPFRRFPDSVPVTDGDTDGRPIVCDIAGGTGEKSQDIERTLMPMCNTGAEPIASMGNDTPLAVLSDRPQLLFNYFRQQFAQVTNPAIDPIREELVMSLTEYIGAVGMNILVPSESHCKMVRLPLLGGMG